MNQRMSLLATSSILIAVVLVLSASFGALSQTTDTSAIAEVLESFRQCALVDPDGAGAIWMNEVTYKSWSDLVGEMDDEPVGLGLFFLHTLMFAEVDDNGVPYGGLYSPWLGALLVFQLDEDGATAVGFSLQLLDRPTDASTPAELAELLMDEMRSAASIFEGAVGLQAETSIDEDIRAELAERVRDAGTVLAPIYATDSDGVSPVQTAIRQLVAGDASGPLSILKREPGNWIASLVPTWYQDTDGGSSVVVLATSYVPLNLVWLDVDSAAGGSVRQAALIKLFDSVTTSGGEGA